MFTLIFASLFFANYSMASIVEPRIPYEREQDCTEESKKYTDILLEEVNQISQIAGDGKTEAQAPCVSCTSHGRIQLWSQFGQMYGPIAGFRPPPVRGVIPDICFFSSMMRMTNEPNYIDCNSSDTTKYREESCRGPRKNPCMKNSKYRPCLNRDYVEAISSSFHELADCFDFSEEDRKKLFALYNHESGFVSNAASTGSSESAACSGQITPPLFYDLVEHIHSRNNLDRYHAYCVIKECEVRTPEGCVKKSKTKCRVSNRNQKKLTAVKIFKDAEKKCPHIRDMIVPQGIVDGKAENLKSSERFAEEAPFFCSLANKPHSCFLYSMYNYKKHQSYYDSTTSYQTYSDFESNEKMGPFTERASRGRMNRLLCPYYEVEKTGGGNMSQGKLRDCPIQMNEMLIFKGDFKSRGRDVNADLVFGDNGEIHRFLDNSVKNIQYERTAPLSPGGLKSFKVEIFPEKLLAKHIELSGHNGGQKVPRTILPVFMNHWKKKIANGQACNANPSCKEYRRKLMNNESLSEEDLQDMWRVFTDIRKYVDTNNRVSNPDENRDFAKNVEKNLGYLKNQATDGDPNPLETRYKNIRPDLAKSQGRIDAFVENVQNTCAPYISSEDTTESEPRYPKSDVR